jgi:hypothetical protein
MFLLRFLLVFSVLIPSHVGCVSVGQQEPQCSQVLADFHNDHKSLSNLPPTADTGHGLIFYAALDEKAQVIHMLCLSSTANPISRFGCKVVGDMQQTCRVNGTMFLYYKDVSFTFQEVEDAKRGINQKPDQID